MVTQGSLMRFKLMDAVQFTGFNPLTAYSELCLIIEIETILIILSTAWGKVIAGELLLYRL